MLQRVVLSWLGAEVDVGLAVDVGSGDVLVVLLMELLKDRMADIIKPSFFYFFWLLVCWCVRVCARVWLSRNKIVFNNYIWNSGVILLLIRLLG